MNIKKPTLIIDQQKVSINIDRMLKKINKNETIFRPHFKTHQNAEIGNIYRNKGVTKITVSSVSMAQYFAHHGWNDITIAFPLNILEIDEVNELANSIKLNILIESELSILELNKIIKYPMGIFIKIDTGYHRTGLQKNDPEIDKIIEVVNANDLLSFKGFLTHAGNTYTAKGSEEILAIMKTSNNTLNKLKQKYISQFPDLIISYGDTPSCSMADNFNGFDEIRPGNFAYYDVMQYHIGSCKLNEIAVVVACPVVASHKERNEVIIYGGSVHLSKECIEADNNFKLYGYVVKFTDNGWTEPITGAYVSSLSQEHGIIKLPDNFVHKVILGDIIGILPIHSCLAANLLQNSYKLI